MSVQMDERFAAALREVLVAEADGAGSSRRRCKGLRRWVAGAGAAIVLAGAAGGIAYAAGVFGTEPGAPRVTALAAPVTVTGIGTRRVELGPAPAGTTAIALSFTCLSAGAFTFADGAGMDCFGAEHPVPTAIDTLPIVPGTDSTKIVAAPGARWRLVATYVSVRTTAWAVNAHGQTYGVENRRGLPDLIAVIATNHRLGYVYADQLDRSPKTLGQAREQSNAPPRALTVYKSDGRTPIGTFVVGR